MLKMTGIKKILTVTLLAVAAQAGFSQKATAAMYFVSEINPSVWPTGLVFCGSLALGFPPLSILLGAVCALDEKGTASFPTVSELIANGWNADEAQEIVTYRNSAVESKIDDESMIKLLDGAPDAFIRYVNTEVAANNKEPIK